MTVAQPTSPGPPVGMKGHLIKELMMKSRLGKSRSRDPRRDGTGKKAGTNDRKTLLLILELLEGVTPLQTVLKVTAI